MPHHYQALITVINGHPELFRDPAVNKTDRTITTQSKYDGDITVSLITAERDRVLASSLLSSWRGEERGGAVIAIDLRRRSPLGH